MRIVFTLLIGFLCPLFCLAQGTWSRAADFPAAGRSNPTVASGPGKAWFGMGEGSTRIEWFEYDANTNVWTRKADAPNVQGRGVAVYLDSLVYMGTGNRIGGTADWYEYEPVTDVWKTMASVPMASSAAFAFGLGGKVYVGGGYDGTAYSDRFFEYDPIANLWTEKAPVPSAIGDATGFAIDSLGYVACGRSGINSPLNTLFCYNPRTDTWTQRAPFPGTPRFSPAGFVLNGLAYVGTGYDGTDRRADFFEYNPAANAWRQVASYGGGGRHWARGFSAGGRGFVAGGVGAGSPDAQVWQFTPPAVSVAAARSVRFGIWPNPATGRLEMEPTNDPIEVHSALGILVRTFPAGTISADLSALPKGTYRLHSGVANAWLVLE